MKKFLFLAVMLLSVNVFAAQTSTEIIDSTLSTSNLDDYATVNIEDAKRVTFFVTIDNNRTTACVTATVTAAISLDGTNWQDISWLDVAGGATPQTSEVTTAADGTYVGWMDNRLVGKYLRIRVNATNMTSYPAAYGTGETMGLTVTVVEDK
jgi:hypothetical protein